jgi:hypothetical protein
MDHALEMDHGGDGQLTERAAIHDLVPPRTWHYILAAVDMA